MRKMALISELATFLKSLPAVAATVVPAAIAYKTMIQPKAWVNHSLDSQAEAIAKRMNSGVYNSKAISKADYIASHSAGL